MEYSHLEYLLELKDWSAEDERYVHNLTESERAFLAENVKNYDGILIDFSLDKNDLIRFKVAQNASTPNNILKKLQDSDSCKDVGEAAGRTLRGEK